MLAAQGRQGDTPGTDRGLSTRAPDQSRVRPRAPVRIADGSRVRPVPSGTRPRDSGDPGRVRSSPVDAKADARAQRPTGPVSVALILVLSVISGLLFRSLCIRRRSGSRVTAAGIEARSGGRPPATAARRISRSIAGYSPSDTRTYTDERRYRERFALDRRRRQARRSRPPVRACRGLTTANSRQSSSGRTAAPSTTTRLRRAPADLPVTPGRERPADANRGPIYRKYTLHSKLVERLLRAHCRHELSRKRRLDAAALPEDSTPGTARGDHAVSPLVGDHRRAVHPAA